MVGRDPPRIPQPGGGPGQSHVKRPRTSFGSLGADHLRLSFAASRENLKRAMAILSAYASDVGAT